MVDNVSEDTINEIIVKAKAVADAPAGVDIQHWQLSADVLFDTAAAVADTDACATLLAARMRKVANRLQLTTREHQQQSTAIVPPDVCRTAASGLGTDMDKKAAYDGDILPTELQYGAFGVVPSYLAFVEAMNPKHTLNETTRKIMNQDVATWCPKKARTTEKETHTGRSVALARILSQELASHDISIVHQTPILPKTKSADNQDVDVALFVENMETTTSSHVAVTIEYKPGKNFSDFESQAAVYGTDYMVISNRSVVVVQIFGVSMSNLDIRAFGVVPWKQTTTTLAGVHHRKSLLYEGKGVVALQMLVSGLRGYVEVFKLEKELNWTAKRLSNVTSLHLGEGEGSSNVVKVYDYRTRQSLTDTERRKPNVALVKAFIDPNAEVKSPEPGLDIVYTKFHERERTDNVTAWFDPVPAKMLGSIVCELQRLHGMNYVHGDIRLLNTILHAGLLVDFDYTASEGTLYPSTLKSLHSDGKRATAVETAIEAENIGDLAMKKQHDLESMIFVLQLFEPDSGNEDLARWWKDAVGAVQIETIFDLIKPLTTTYSTCKVKLRVSLDVVDPAGTDSPQKKF